MRCSHCGNHKGGTYKDSCNGSFFNLCLDCCKELSFYPNCLNTQIKCDRCGLNFTPRKAWIKSCTDCWIKTQPDKKTNFTFIKIPAQRELNGGVVHG